jgi:hypothetical protein|eukprot:3568789-Prymnesium_polylepis.1
MTHAANAQREVVFSGLSQRGQLAIALAAGLFISKYDGEAPTYKTPSASLYADWATRKAKDGDVDPPSWHQERSEAWLGTNIPYIDMPIASYKYDKVSNESAFCAVL